MLLAANNQKVNLKWFKKLRELEGKAPHPPCPPAAPLGCQDCCEDASEPWLKVWDPIGVEHLGTHQGAFDGCHCASGRGRWALNWWQIAKRWQVFSELLYQLAFEIPKTKPIGLGKMSSIRTEGLLKGVTIGSVSSLAQWCHHSPRVLTFSLLQLCCVDFLRLAVVWFLFCFGFLASLMLIWQHPLTIETILICVCLTAKRFFYNHQQHHILFPKSDPGT